MTDRLGDFQTETQRVSTYLRDKNNKNTVFAYANDGARVPLRDCRLVNLYHMDGIWRIREGINSGRQK